MVARIFAWLPSLKRRNKSKVIGPSSLLQSGLSLFHRAGAQSLSAAGSLSSGSPDEMVDGMVGLQMAETQAKLGNVMIRVSQEMDDALLDILV